MKDYKNQQFEKERALYGINKANIINCQFDGKEDGESALKEASFINISNCYFNLRYPLWHSCHIKLVSSNMTSLCRAAIWYTSYMDISDCSLEGIKAIRECDHINIQHTKIDSKEFGWRSKYITMSDVTINSEYGFFEAKELNIDQMKFSGKYSFQYIHNMVIRNSTFDTKDAFWHSKNVTVYDSIIKGEYLGWYSSNLTLINCHIEGTQPFCYCKNLKLINCTTSKCDLAFENSSVHASIKGHIDSIKNPRSGVIVVDSVNEIINDASKYKAKGKVIVKSNK